MPTTLSTNISLKKPKQKFCVQNPVINTARTLPSRVTRGRTVHSSVHRLLQYHNFVIKQVPKRKQRLLTPKPHQKRREKARSLVQLHHSCHIPAIGPKLEKRKRPKTLSRQRMVRWMRGIATILGSNRVNSLRQLTLRRYRRRKTCNRTSRLYRSRSRQSRRD